MRKTIAAFFLTLLMFCTASAQAYQIKADAMTKRLPMGTRIELEAAKTVTTETVNAGDMFSAYLTKDIYSDGEMVLPKGTILRGNSSKIIKPKMLSRSGVLYLNFDHIVATNGKQLPLKAGIGSCFNLTEDGGIDGGGGYGRALLGNLNKSGEIIKKATLWGIKSGEELFTGGKYLITPIAAAGGTFTGAGYLVGKSTFDIFRKGKDAVIEKGQIFDIILLEPLDVPVF